MLKEIFSFFMIILLVGCSESQDDSLPPPSAEIQASQKFYNHPVVNDLKSEGVEIECRSSCVGVTDRFMTLLSQNINGLVRLSRKVERFEIVADWTHSFSSPAGQYIMYLPLDLNQEALDLVYKIFDKIFVLEEKVPLKAYPRGYDPKNLKAFDKLIENADRFMVYPIKKLELVSGGTSLSSHGGEAELNIDSVVDSLDRVFKRLNLFVDFYQKVPNLDLGVLGTDPKIYELLGRLLQRSQEVARSLSYTGITRLVVMEEVEDYYFSISLLGIHSISFHISQTVDDILKVIDYEMNLLELETLLQANVFHKGWHASYKVHPVCAEKIPHITGALLEKAEKIKSISIDNGIDNFGFPTPFFPTSFNGETLSLNCFEDSVESMLGLINSIE